MNAFEANGPICAKQQSLNNHRVAILHVCFNVWRKLSLQFAAIARTIRNIKRLMFCHNGTHFDINDIALLAALKNAVITVLIEMRARLALLWKMLHNSVWFMQNLHIRTRVPWLGTRLFTRPLPTTFRLRLLITVT